MSPSALLAVALLAAAPTAATDARPNILVAISDDQSWVHASAYGYEAISTPAFDRVAREGALFTQAFSPTPGCSPTRAAFLTGRHSWMIEHAGTHASSFPRQYPVWPDSLEQSGYVIGATGKLWGPGNWKISGWERNPAGPGRSDLELTPPAEHIRKTDYAANFASFLEERPKDRPFAFWYGASEPDRAFSPGVGLRSDKRLEDVVVPPLPRRGRSRTRRASRARTGWRSADRTSRPSAAEERSRCGRLALRRPTGRSKLSLGTNRP